MTLSSPQSGSHAAHGAAGPRHRKATLWDVILARGSVVSIALFFMTVCIVFSVITDAFLTAPNLLNIIRQSAPLLIAAAMTFVITTGGIDLPVGSVLALVAILSATDLQAACPGRWSSS